MAITLTVLEDSAPGIGACVLLEYAGRRLLLDCGWDDSEAAGRCLSFPIPARTIDAVILSHGHLGHCGLLPVLVREGFAGKVYATADTGRSAGLGMLEAALLQEEEKQYWAAQDRPGSAARGPCPGSPATGDESRVPGAEPTYTETEVTVCEQLLVPCPFGERVALDEHLAIEFFPAGHCLGSAIIKLDLRQGDSHRKILYVGDVGADGHGLYAEPVLRDAFDPVILPAFHAARRQVDRIETRLAQIINEAREAGGNVIIPTFSLDRRDAVLQIIQDLSVREQIPSIFVFLDSPIASRQCAALSLMAQGTEIYPCLRPIDTVSDSKSLNQIRGTAVILAGSGRGGYGRIGFHLRKNLARAETALVLFGRQAGRWPGQALEEGCTTLSIQNQPIEVKARIHRLENPTVHLDVEAVREWLTRVKSIPRHVCITHGTPEAKAQFAAALHASGIQNVHAPAAGEALAL